MLDAGKLAAAMTWTEPACDVAVARERALRMVVTGPGLHRAAQAHMRALIWWFYADLKAYRADPGPRRRGEMRARFDRIFARRTGFAALDRLLARLHANKPELLMVLDRPEDSAAHQRLGARHSLPGHQAQDQWRHPQRRRP